MICAKIAIIFKDTNKYTFMKLIKIDGYWIIVSDEERVKGDIVLGNFPDNPIGIITDIYGEEFTVTCFNGDKVGLAQYDSFKILYSQNPEHNLSSITFSDKVAKKLGIIDIKQKAINYASNRRNGGGFGYPSFTANCIEKGYNKGYKQALSDNKDKLFTANEMYEKIALWFGRGVLAGKERRVKELIPNKDKIIQSLTKQEYEVELEMEEDLENDWVGTWTSLRKSKVSPAITNNSVKVIKIIK